MNKFTAFIMAFIVIICLLFTGIIINGHSIDQKEAKKAEEEFNKTQTEAIPEKVDAKTIEHSKEVKEEAKKTAEEVKKTAEKEKKTDLVSEYGDTVVIDYVGIQNGKEFEGGTSQDYSLELGSNSFITGYEIQLEDHKIGDVVEAKVTFPEDYSSEDLAGKNAMFIVTIKDIQKKE